MNTKYRTLKLGLSSQEHDQPTNRPADHTAIVFLGMFWLLRETNPMIIIDCVILRVVSLILLQRKNGALLMGETSHGAIPPRHGCCYYKTWRDVRPWSGDITSVYCRVCPGSCRSLRPHNSLQSNNVNYLKFWYL